MRYCRRLGKVIPGKVQPLLVTVRSEEQALTQSLDPTVRDHVYFNPDLTKAQANAAYQARCQRGQLQAARNSRSSNTSALPLSSHILTPIQCHHHKFSTVQIVANPSIELVAFDMLLPNSKLVVYRKPSVYQPVNKKVI